jgi:hypothetical protein
MLRKVLVYGRSFTIFQLINRPPISLSYQLFFTPTLNDLVPRRVNTDIVLVGGGIPEGERAEIVKRFHGSKTIVALLPQGALRDWGRDRVVEGIFNVLNESVRKAGTNTTDTSSEEPPRAS